MTLVTVWIAFIAFVLVMLALDLFVLNRNPHVIKTREALGWTGVCILLGLAFNGCVYYLYENDVGGIGTRYQQHYSVEAKSKSQQNDDHHAAAEPPPEAVTAPQTATLEPTPTLPTGAGKPALIQFFTGWIIEYSLSLDNIFVIALIFTHFRIPAHNQHRVLFWGILGALVLRAVMILAGTALVNSLSWILYVFGAFLILTAIKLLRQQEEDFKPEEGLVYRTARKLLPLSDKLDGDRFFTRIDGKVLATPLFLVLLVVEATDVVFAVDSIPAILSITSDPFLVFTSNVFAILGLRSLYFALAALMDKFSYLKFSLSFILAFVGVKMIIEQLGVHVSHELSLGIIATALTAGVGTSLIMAPKAQPSPHEPPHTTEPEGGPSGPV